MSNETRKEDEHRRTKLDNSVRELICRKYDSGKPVKVISEELDVKYKTVYSILKIYKDEHRSHTNARNSGRKKSVTPEICRYIKSLIEEDCSITLNNMKSKILEEKGVSLSAPTLHRSIANFEYSFKRVVLIPEARNKESNIQRRFEYARDIMTRNIDDLVFVDEMGVNCSMRQRYGRSAVGIPPRKTITSIRSQNISVCAAISRNGALTFKVLEKAFNADHFRIFVTDLLEELHRLAAVNKVLIIDNASIHKNKELKQLIEEAGHQLIFLPPYTPQLNPIEEFFSAWKSKIRSANCSSKVELMACINNKHVELTSSHCLAFYSHMQAFLVKALEKESF